jgi:O-succinylbenzoate synthase
MLVDYLFSDKAQYEQRIVRSHVECNALGMPGLDIPLESQCTAAVEKGFRSLKIKITPHTSSEVVACMHKVASGTACSFRLDANQSFSLVEFQRLVPRLEGLPIEYCEEPISDPEELPALIAQCPVPIALDETTRVLDVEEWIGWGAKGVVLKPSLNGGLLSLLPIIARIGASGAKVTLSSSFESGVGLRAIALVASLASECGAVGLDTASFLQDDHLRPHFPVGEPNLSVQELIRCRYQGV